jgi:hypothetical protein
MQAWIVKHVRLSLYLHSKLEARTRVDRLPQIYWHREAAINGVEHMEVPDDWRVVEVEITEKE